MFFYLIEKGKVRKVKFKVISQNLVCKFHDHHGHYFLHCVSSFTHSHTLCLPTCRNNLLFHIQLHFNYNSSYILSPFHGHEHAHACTHVSMRTYFSIFKLCFMQPRIIKVCMCTHCMCGMTINLAMRKEVKFKLKISCHPSQQKVMGHRHAQFSYSL